MPNEVVTIEGLVVEELQTPREDLAAGRRLRDELSAMLEHSFQVRRAIRLSYENGIREGLRRAAIVLTLASVVALAAGVCAGALLHHL